MSTFIDSDNGILIPLGSSISDMVTTIMDALTTRGWQVSRMRDQATAIIGDGLDITYAFNTNHMDYSRLAVNKYIGFIAPTGFTPTLLYLTAKDGKYPASYGGPRTFSLDYSDNGTSWTTLQTWTNEPVFAGKETRKYEISGAGAHLYWRLYVTAIDTLGGSSCAIYCFLLEDASGLSYQESGYSRDVFPPSSETIGNAQGRELVRVFFASNGGSIQFYPVMETMAAIPSVMAMWGVAAGAVTSSVTLGGQTVSYTGESGDSAQANWNGLYSAIRTSVLSNFTALNWTRDQGFIVGWEKTATGNLAPTSSNASSAVIGSYVAAGTPQARGLNDSSHTLPSVSCDLVSGFIYYLQVGARGFAIATKTNAGYFGPVHACYADNTKAAVFVPVAANVFSPLNTPVELVVGTNSATTTLSDGTAMLTHGWGVNDHMVYQNPQDTDSSASVSYGGSGHPFSGLSWKGSLYDAAPSSSHLARWWVFGAYGESFINNAGATFNIHQMGVYPQKLSQATENTNKYTDVVIPPVDGLDWYRYTGSVANEQVIVAAVDDFATTLSTDCGTIDDYISVASTTGFPASGWIVVDGELISYAAKSADQFTGCVRGKFGTNISDHYTGDKLRVAGWWIKINTGLIFCGYEEPT